MSENKNENEIENDVTILEKLFDEENDESIFLFAEDGKEIELEQVAAIEYEGQYYAVLHPIDAEEDEVVVFRVDPDDEDSVIMVEDEHLIDIILKQATSE